MTRAAASHVCAGRPGATWTSVPRLGTGSHIHEDEAVPLARLWLLLLLPALGPHLHGRSGTGHAKLRRTRAEPVGELNLINLA